MMERLVCGIEGSIRAGVMCSPGSTLEEIWLAVMNLSYMDARSVLCGFYVLSTSDPRAEIPMTITL